MAFTEGLRTLEIRLQRSADSTRQVLAWLKKHPLVHAGVLSPGP